LFFSFISEKSHITHSVVSEGHAASDAASSVVLRVMAFLVCARAKRGKREDDCQGDDDRECFKSHDVNHLF